MTTVVLPYRGEFGFKCMEMAPQVNAIKGKKIICIEPGDEALFPGAFRYIRVAARDDKDRRARNEEELIAEAKADMAAEVFELAADGELDWVVHDGNAPREYFVPQPYNHVEVADEIDVVICPRKREYGSDKNWPYWQELADKLMGHGMKLFSAGAPDSSFDIAVNAGHAWDDEFNGRCLDATIAAMHKAKFVVATDAGLAHLAVMCGTPLLMITHKNGLVAPGQDDVGNDYWPVHMDRYERENHTGSEIRQVIWGFTDWNKVAEKAFLMLMQAPLGGREPVVVGEAV